MNPYVFRVICDVQRHLSSVGASLPSSTVEAFAVHSNGNRTILALACSSEILFLFSNGDDSIDSEYEVHSISWAHMNQKKIVACMTFSPCGRWLACVLMTGAIEIVPVSMALNSRAIGNTSGSSVSLFPFNEISTIDLRVRDDCLGLPTCVVWYETKQKRHMLVYSNKGGDILFVDLVVRRLSASLQAPQSIHNLEIIEEASHDDVYLLVSGFTGTQWLVPLEQRNMSLRETLARIVPSELKELNVRGLVNSVKSGGCNCLGVLHEDIFRLFNTTNFGTPILELLLPENTFAVRYTDVLTFSVHKQVLVSYSFNCCSTNDYAPETREQFTALIGELPECRFLGFFALPNSGDETALPSCLFVTETSVYMATPKWTTREYLANLLLTDKKLTLIELYCQAVGLNFQTSCFDAVPALLERKAVERALQICSLSKAPLYAIAKQFVDRGFASFILPQINSWLTGGLSKASSASEQSRRELSHLAFELFLETCKSSEGFEKNKADQNFKNFLLHNIWYDPDYCMKTLLQLRMYDCTLAVVKVHGLYENLAKEIITMDAWDEKDDAFLSLISVPGLSAILLDARSTYCHHYLSRLEQTFPNILPAQQARFLALFDPEKDEMVKLLDAVKSSKKVSIANGQNGSSSKSLADDVVRFFLSSLIAYLYDGNASGGQSGVMESSALSTGSSKTEPQDLVPVACGAEHCCLFASDGIVYAFGRNRYGCLGDRADQSVTASPPVQINFPPMAKVEIVQMACGSDHTVCLTKTGALYSWGSNKFGQLGIGREMAQANKPVLLSKLDGSVPVIKIDCGQYHSFALDGYGKAWGWGWNVYRQIGVGNRAEDIFHPTRLLFFEKAVLKSVSCGYAHTIFLTEKGRLYGCGSNSYGQLALDDVKKTMMPRRLRIAARCQPAFTGQSDELFDHIASGFFHNIALSRSRRLFTWGATPQSLKFKALLHKRKNQQQATSSPAPETGAKPSSSILNGSETGTGGGMNGLVDARQLCPNVVDMAGVENKKIVQLACGFHHSLLRTEDGQLYTWGKNFEFQLGHADKKERPAPALVTAVGQPIAYAACGSDFTIAVDMNRLLWGWGKNDLCQLGFESLAPNEKRAMAGRVLTIQRPNKGGQRTIQLPQDARTYVSKPVRIAGLRSMWPLESGNDTEKALKKKYSKLFLMNVMKMLKSYYDPQEIISLCNRYRAEEMSSFVYLLNGNLEEACRISLGTLSSQADCDQIEVVLSFFGGLAEKLPLDTARTSDLLRIIFEHVPKFQAMNFDINDFLEKKLDFWAPAIIKLLTEDSKKVPLKISLRLRAAQVVHRLVNKASQTSGPIYDGELGRFADVAQEDVVRAAASGDRYSYKFSCGHVVGETMARNSLTAVANDEIVTQRAPGLIDCVQQYVDHLENLPFDICPLCLTRNLSRVFSCALSHV